MWGNWEEWRLPWNALYERRINELKKKDIFTDGKVSGSQEPKNTTHMTNHTLEICWEGKIQKGGCLCVGEKQQEN